MKYLIMGAILLFATTSCFGLNNTNREKPLENPPASVNTSGTVKNQENPAKPQSSDNNNLPKKEASIEFFNNENNVFQLLPIDKSKLLSSEIEIKGEAKSQTIEKIEVSFSNRESSFPTDLYTLQTYKKGDTNFRYVASANFRVLDYGLNQYTFTAYLSGGEKESIDVEIYIPKKSTAVDNNDSGIMLEDKGIVSYEKKLFGSGTLQQYMSFPQSDAFGKPIFTSEKSFTYSNINNFEVNQVENITISCEDTSGITDFLMANYSWVYWNTCRPIVKDKGFSFYVLRVDGETYKYEKHYFDTAHNFYAIYLVESGIGINKDNIDTKNTELKEQSFPFVETVDELMYEIVR